MFLPQLRRAANQMETHMRAMRFVAVLIVVWKILSPTNSEQAAAHAQASSKDAVVATCGADHLNASELDARAASKLAKLKAEEYRIQRTVVEEWIAERALAHEAARKQMSVEELIRTEVDARVPAVSVLEAQAVLEHNGQALRAGIDSYQAAVASIQRDLRARRVAIKKQQFIWDLRKSESARVLLVQPRLAIDVSGKPFRGKASAPVTIVVFADYECPFCAQLAPTLDGVMARFGDDTRLIYRHFPLDIHKNAAKAAEAAECAGEQGKFWEMNDLLYKSRQQLAAANLKKLATDLQLDRVRFDNCLDSSQMAPVWRADKSAAELYGVNGTPTLFINGRMLPGVPSVNTLTLLIEEELALSKER